jgi:hypothetical protein
LLFIRADLVERNTLKIFEAFGQRRPDRLRPNGRLLVCYGGRDTGGPARK